MALEDFTVQKNTGHVEQAVAGMSEGQIADIEKRAQAKVVEAEVESHKVAAIESKVGGAASSTEGKVYGEIATKAIAPGLELVQTVAEFIGSRKADLNIPTIGAETHPAMTPARTMEHDVQLAGRAPGVYSAPVKTSIYGGGSAKSETPVSDTASVFDRAKIAETSLKDQGKEAIGSWSVRDAKVEGVKLAKELTFGLRNANEMALQSVAPAREYKSAATYQANQMAPGLAMASGPTIRPDQLLREAREESGRQSA